MNDWISVKERLPNLKDYILATDGDLIAGTIFRFNEHIQKYHWDYFSSGCGCCDGAMKNVTHWMPLPEPPKD